MALNYDPKYDTDNITLGYLKKVLGEESLKSSNISKNISLIKNYGSTPIPPYSIGDTWTSSNKVYKCIESRPIGSFNINDWVEIYDKETSTAISNNFQFLSSVELVKNDDNKIETFYQSDDPSINWTTDEIKKCHIGDYYQNSTDYKIYQYVMDENEFKWQEKSVTTIIFDPTTGHRNIFLKRPDNYIIGDIWKINNQNDLIFDNVNIGDFMRAKLTNTIFNQDDWEKVTNELSLKANLYSSAGIMISSGNILTNLQYVSDGPYNGYQLLGFNEYITRDGHQKNYSDLVIDVDLPDNFKIVSAYLTLFHTPVYWSYYDLDSGSYGDNWGYSRNIRLYKYKNENNFKLYMAFANEYRYEVSNSDLEEIKNAFKGTSYNPTNQTGISIEKKTTVNIKSALNSIGKTKLVVRTGDSVPSTASVVTQKTGMARAIINILGYIDPKEG